MSKTKFDLAYFRKAIPDIALDANHRRCLFAEDCRMIKKFKGNPLHYHFFSKLERMCFTVEISTNNVIRRISNN